MIVGGPRYRALAAILDRREKDIKTGKTRFADDAELGRMPDRERDLECLQREREHLERGEYGDCFSCHKPIEEVVLRKNCHRKLCDDCDTTAELQGVIQSIRQRRDAGLLHAMHQ